jgi:hypothetical protein
MASNFYRGADSPRFILGHALELAFIGGGLIACVILLVGYSAENRRRARKIDEGALDLYSPEELSDKGDKAVTYRYVY